MTFLLKKPQRGFEAKVLHWTGTISRSKTFWFILTLKIAASFVFASPMLTDFFIPFLEAFVAAPSSNVYEFFWRQGMDQIFPYPAVTLWCMGLPRLLLYWVGFHDLPLNVLLFVYRIPLILADIAILMILCRWLRQHIGLLLWLYWASPVMFYITYLHGQLDVIAMALALLSTYFIFSNRWMQSAILFGLAVAAKMHLLLMLPFVLVYFWQANRQFRMVFPYFTISSMAFLAVNLPYIFGEGFAQIVLLNAEQGKVGMVTLGSNIDGIAFYIIPALLLFLIFYSVFIQIKNRDVFLFFIGSAFGVILLFIPPAPGWYYWFLPFLIYFYTRLSSTFLLPFIALQTFYFVYFAVIPASDFSSFLQVFFKQGLDDSATLYDLLISLGVDGPLIVGLAFTALQTVLFINTGFMLYCGVHLLQRSKLRSRPFMVGISGDSASGKTTLAKDIETVLGIDRVGLTCGDDMHKWERGSTRWNDLTHLNPIANELHDELDFIKQLRENKRIRRRHYDHDTGKFTNKLAIEARSIMIMEGLHSFYLKPTRDLFDLKIFMKPDPDLLLHRKLVRDIEKRSTNKEDVLKSIVQRQVDLAAFIEVQERHADIVVSMIPIMKIPQKSIGKYELSVQERLRVTLSNSYYVSLIVSDLIEILPESVRHFYDAQDQQVIEIDCLPEDEVIRALGEKHLSKLESFGIYDPPWTGGWSGLLQLLIVYCIFEDWGGGQS